MESLISNPWGLIILGGMTLGAFMGSGLASAFLIIKYLGCNGLVARICKLEILIPEIQATLTRIENKLENGEYYGQ